jgi:hypothetical protein
VGGTAVGGSAVFVGGGSGVADGTSVGGRVASTITVCIITTGVGEGPTTVGVGGSVGAAVGALLHATKITASKRITNFFIVNLLVELIKKFYNTINHLSR